MAWGFRKRFTLFPGVRLNFSKSGISASIGPRGASVTVGKLVTHVNVGIPGTGLSYRAKVAEPPKQSVETPEEVLAQVMPDLKISVQDITHQGGKHYFINFEFTCKKCGGHILTRPEGDSDDKPMNCKSCGTFFGSNALVRETAKYVGKVELKRRGL